MQVSISWKPPVLPCIPRLDPDQVQLVTIVIGKIVATVAVFLAVWFWKLPLETIRFIYLIVIANMLWISTLVMHLIGWFCQCYCGFLWSFVVLCFGISNENVCTSRCRWFVVLTVIFSGTVHSRCNKCDLKFLVPDNFINRNFHFCCIAWYSNLSCWMLALNVFPFKSDSIPSLTCDFLIRKHVSLQCPIASVRHTNDTKWFNSPASSMVDCRLLAVARSNNRVALCHCSWLWRCSIISFSSQTSTFW